MNQSQKGSRTMNIARHTISTALLIVALATGASAADRPNILILFPDDVGWQNRPYCTGRGTVHGSLRPTLLHRWQGGAHHRAVPDPQRYDHGRPPGRRAGSQAAVAHSG